MTTWITICDTCKRDGWDQGKMTQTDGEKLASLVEAIAVNSPVRTRRTSCMMGCKHGCNVAIQAQEKLCYTIGNFEPSTEAAEAIVAYSELHAASSTGQVPYRQWPQALKGHFVTRHQPLPKDE
ncbi:MAG: DUF1636 domain-containing protein [Marinosulfonomonas sp.]|nr:DUF1636 domain-containing protein [Marinosulfonomonas sp.]